MQANYHRSLQSNCLRVTRKPIPTAVKPQRPGTLLEASTSTKITMKRRPGGASSGEDPLVRLSKSMSRMLRHHPPPGAMDAQGWMALPLLLQHLKGQVTEEQVRAVVDTNDKKRFVIDDSTQPPRIRAAQGHSIQLEDPVLDPVLDPTAVACAVHVTSSSSWQAIQESGELRRMNRTHIHFATLPLHMRTNSWAQVLLRLDLQAAMAAGHQFFLSSNQVLLTEGPLSTTFVSQIHKNDLPEDWKAEQPQPKQHRGG